MIIRNRSLCTHEWVAVTGPTVCVHCGQDLGKALDLIRSDAIRGQQADEEPNVPTFADAVATWPSWLIYTIAFVLGIAGGLSFAAGLIALVNGATVSP